MTQLYFESNFYWSYNTQTSRLQFKKPSRNRVVTTSFFLSLDTKLGFLKCIFKKTTLEPSHPKKQRTFCIAVVINRVVFDRAESAAKGVIDAYKKGASGSTWVASRDLPAVDITDNVNRAYDILGEHN